MNSPNCSDAANEARVSDQDRVDERLVTCARHVEMICVPQLLQIDAVVTTRTSSSLPMICTTSGRTPEARPYQLGTGGIEPGDNCVLPREERARPGDADGSLRPFTYRRGRQR